MEELKIKEEIHDLSDKVYDALINEELGDLTDDAEDRADQIIQTLEKAEKQLTADMNRRNKKKFFREVRKEARMRTNYTKPKKRRRK